MNEMTIGLSAAALAELETDPAFLAYLGKQEPGGGDVHVSSAGGGKKPKAPKKPVLDFDELEDQAGSAGTNASKAAADKAIAEMEAAQKNVRDAMKAAVDKAIAEMEAAHAAEKAALLKRLGTRNKVLTFGGQITKVDAKLGLVFGYAIVCKVDGEDYYDLNVDPDGERVPEHIPEDAMLKAAADFMEHHRVAKEMHSGDPIGPAVFAFPLTTEIAKALEIIPHKTGLLFAMKPSAEVLGKFVSGEYTGFSIGGVRIRNEDVD